METSAFGNALSSFAKREIPATAALPCEIAESKPPNAIGRQAANSMLTLPSISGIGMMPKRIRT